jgi:hypothetical protein
LVLAVLAKLGTQPQSAIAAAIRFSILSPQQAAAVVELSTGTRLTKMVSLVVQVAALETLAVERLVVLATHHLRVHLKEITAVALAPTRIQTVAVAVAVLAQQAQLAAVQAALVEREQLLVLQAHQ